MSNYSSMDDKESMATIQLSTPHAVDDEGDMHYSPPGSPTWKKKLPFQFKIPNLLPHGGILASAINIAQAALGAGTLGFAEAMKNAGVGIGLFFAVLFCITTCYAVRLLTLVMEKHKLNTYEALSAKLIHPKAKTFLAVIIIIYYWGTTILYVIALGDIIHPLTDSSYFPDWCHGVDGKRAVISLFWFFFMNPLSLLKEMNSLRFSSFLGLVSIFILMFAIVYHAHEDSVNKSTKIAWAKFDLGMMIALPTICFSYSCQALCFGIYHEMHPRSVNRMTVATAIAMFTSSIIYLSCGIGGYVDFGEDTKGDILRNYANPTGKAYLMTAFIGMGLTITVSFPVCIVPTRDSMLQLMGYKDVYHTPSLIRIALALFLSLTSLVIGLYVENISILFSLLGGICGSTVCFIFPALLALRSGDWDVEHVGLHNMILTWVMLGGGICTLVLGTIAGCIQNL